MQDNREERRRTAQDKLAFLLGAFAGSRPDLRYETPMLVGGPSAGQTVVVTYGDLMALSGVTYQIPDEGPVVPTA